MCLIGGYQPGATSAAATALAGYSAPEPWARADRDYFRQRPPPGQDPPIQLAVGPAPMGATVPHRSSIGTDHRLARAPRPQASGRAPMGAAVPLKRSVGSDCLFRRAPHPPS